MIALEGELENDQEEQKEKWSAEFESSNFYESLNDFQKENSTIPLREDPYRGIGRNQRITIKYNDGRILENIKFKKMEADLRNGIGEIIKK